MSPIGSLCRYSPKAFPVMTGKGDRGSGGRGTKTAIIRGFHFRTTHIR